VEDCAKQEQNFKQNVKLSGIASHLAGEKFFEHKNPNKIGVFVLFAALK